MILPLISASNTTNTVALSARRTSRPIDASAAISERAGFRPVSGMAGRARCGDLSGQREAEIAELLDRGDELVAGLEPDLLVLGVAGDHARRGAGEDDVAGLERHVVGNVAHQ